MPDTAGIPSTFDIFGSPQPSGLVVTTPVLSAKAHVIYASGAIPTIILPAGTNVGDICLVFLCQISPPATDGTPPNGWYQVMNPALRPINGGNTLIIEVWAKTVQTEDLAVGGFTFPMASNQSAVVYTRCYSKCGGVNGFASRTSTTATPATQLPPKAAMLTKNGLTVVAFNMDASAIGPTATIDGTGLLNAEAFPSGFLATGLFEIVGQPADTNQFRLTSGAKLFSGAVAISLLPIETP